MHGLQNFKQWAAEKRANWSAMKEGQVESYNENIDGNKEDPLYSKKKPVLDEDDEDGQDEEKTENQKLRDKINEYDVKFSNTKEYQSSEIFLKKNKLKAFLKGDNK